MTAVLTAVYWLCMIWLVANAVASTVGLLYARRQRRAAERQYRDVSARLDAELAAIIRAAQAREGVKS